MGTVTNITSVIFSVGELFHQLFDYRGVIVDVERNFQGTVEKNLCPTFITNLLFRLLQLRFLTGTTTQQP